MSITNNSPYEAITHVISYAALINKSSWETSCPAQASLADICIIRSITLAGPSVMKAYLIWCSAFNDYIGCLSGEGIYAPSAMTTYLINSPIGNTISFKLYQINADGSISPDETATGNFMINLEFVKYKKPLV